jgi:hypothetical protein
MKKLAQIKIVTPSLFILATAMLACAALAPLAKAVSPPPDGGYPGGNTAEGQSALFSLTTGGYNTAVGVYSLKNNTIGGFNTAIGAGALLVNLEAQNNTATGAGALLSNGVGNENTANGAFALFYNNGDQNCAFGSYALFFNDIGSENTAIGQSAMYENGTGERNTAVGFSALYGNHDGWDNTAIGLDAGLEASGSGNICIGSGARGFFDQEGVIQIGGDFSGYNACYINGIYGQSVDPGTGSGTYIDSDGKLGTMLSSRRFKRDIEPMDTASEPILALKPVTFHYKADAKNTPCFGLIAEEVAKANPDLVVRNKKGELLSVRYDQINAMLLNEFLKEHKKVEEQQATIAELKAEVAQQQKDFQATVARLIARLDEQAAQIQKVSTEVEMSGRASLMVLNKP